MMTFAEYHKEKMKDPDFKREYDALEDWFQEELAVQEKSAPRDAHMEIVAKGKAIRTAHVSFA